MTFWSVDTRMFTLFQQSERLWRLADEIIDFVAISYRRMFLEDVVLLSLFFRFFFCEVSIGSVSTGNRNSHVTENNRRLTSGDDFASMIAQQMALSVSSP